METSELIHEITRINLSPNEILAVHLPESMMNACDEDIDTMVKQIRGDLKGFGIENKVIVTCHGVTFEALKPS